MMQQSHKVIEWSGHRIIESEILCGFDCFYVCVMHLGKKPRHQMMQQSHKEKHHQIIASHCLLINDSIAEPNSWETDGQGTEDWWPGM